MSHKHTSSLTSYFTVKVYALAIGALVGLHLIVSYLQQIRPFIMHTFWPLSVFTLSRPFVIDGITLSIIGLSWLSFEKLYLNKKRKIGTLLPIIIMLTILTNLLQGYHDGLVQPALGQGNRDFSYWSDASVVAHMGAASFVANYTKLQPTLGYHGRVHPPGPTVILHLLRSILEYPVLISLAMCAISTLSVLVIYQLTKSFTNRKTARFISVLYALLPAFQIYGLASFDALIALGSIITISVWLQQKSHFVIKTAIAFFVTSMLNFSSVWLFAVLVITAYKENLNDTIKLIGSVIMLYVAANYLFGYNYLESFQVAASYEGSSQGFYAFIDPASYIVTRIQDILEPLVFLGPGLSMGIILMLASKSTDTLVRLAKVSTSFFLIFLLAGAYYTGETARAALYIIPPLLCGLAHWIQQDKLNTKQQINVFRMVFAQSVLMQLFGYYSW